MSDGNEVQGEKVVVPFKKAPPEASLSPPAQAAGPHDLLVVIELMHQRLFILESTNSALIAFSTDEQRQVALGLVRRAEGRYQPGVLDWPEGLVPPPIERMIEIYSGLFRVRL